ncbi:telomere-associated protein RIF1 [Rhinophrynus dorsalis]
MAATCSEDSHLMPLVETLEDSSASHTEQTDAYLSIANRLSGEEGKDFTVLVAGQFPRLCKAFKAHISNENSDLSNAALQALGFCVFNNKIASVLSASGIEELLSALSSIAVRASDKNTCTRALWVISKQTFSSEEVGKVVPIILSTLESVLNKDVQSLVIEYEALNVIIRLLEQTPTQMTAEAVRWTKLILPLVVHSAPKVRLRAATALEMGVPLLLQKQPEVAALTEQMMTSKIIAELQKLFSSKNETYVLRLWPLFVKLLGKTLHRSGSFINSLLQLEELGFRSGSPAVKKIAFIAWKSLIDNFALNPDILCSTKRLKLLMQPLSSIHVRTEALALTKIEVWWYLVMRLGCQLPVHFEQVCLPLIQSALSVDSSSGQTTSLRTPNQSMAASTPLQKGAFPFGSPATPKINLNTSLLTSIAFPSVHLLGIEMMLHFLLGPEVVNFASQHKLVLSLEPLQHPLISSSLFFCKHAATLLNAVQDGFITIGKDASDAVLNAVWKDMIDFVKAAMDTGSKKERQGSEVLTYLLQALKNIVTSDGLQVEKSMSLLEHTIKGLPQKVLGSAAYQVANMDLLNGTPALFLIQLHFYTGLLEKGVLGERFFVNFETLVNYVISGPTSLAFSESVLGELNQSAKFIENKEHLWRMWSILINPLTEWVNQTNEVNQGDALEHNFSSMHCALMLPILHIFSIPGFPQPTMKTLLRTWADLYKAFARCASLVATTEENVCCEELCTRILSHLGDSPMGLTLLERVAQIIPVIVDCVSFSPYSTKYQPKTKAPHTPTDWSKKKKEPLGNLNALLKLLVKLLESFHHLGSDESNLEASAASLVSIGGFLIGAISTCISHISLPSLIRTVFLLLTKPLSVFFQKKKYDGPKVYSGLNNKLDKLIGDILVSLGSRYNGPYDSELLEALSPLLCTIFMHKNKQIRNQAAQFWNGSFAKATVLTYPEELRPVLNQVKLKTPLLLPGFTFTSEELSGPYSDNTDNSQLETKVSGIEVRSTGKRDSLLSRTEQLKDKGTPTRASQAKLKLDFSSPKPKEKLLEEEHSVDFVFIPPEAKERVLTEHQKEILKTKRVDIPTMYNTLDASQDTALFTQYSQSQENSLEKPTVIERPEENLADSKENHPEGLPKDNVNKIPEPMSGESAADEIQYNNEKPSEELNDSAVSETKETQANSSVSNSSASSDMVLGTPPPPASRRQSFITLEKFDNSVNRSFSPLSSTKFPQATEVVLVPDSQEAMDLNKVKADDDKKAKPDLKSPKTEMLKPAAKRGRKPKAPRVPELAESKPSISVEENPESTAKANDSRDEDEEFVPNTQTQELEPKLLENDKVGDCVAELNMESKENTPPEAMNHVKNEDSKMQQVNSNQMSLRRSSRRHSEILEGVKNVANEIATQKRDQTKEEKPSQKKVSQSKETPQKLQHEKLEKSQEKDQDIVTKPLSEERDNDQSILTSDTKQDEEQQLPDSNLSKESQEMSRSRPRYQTRRSLQALVSGSENSESDHSETREENGKRKRSWRNKTKSIEGLEKSDNSETSPQLLAENETKTEVMSLSKIKNESGSEINMEVDNSSASDGGNTCTVNAEDTMSTTKILNKEQIERTEPEPIPDTTDINKTYDVTKYSTTLNTQEINKTYDVAKNVNSVCTTEINETYDVTKNATNLLSTGINKTYDVTKNATSLLSTGINETYDVTKNATNCFSTGINGTYDLTKNSAAVCSTVQSLMTEPTIGDFSTAVSDVFQHSESNLQSVDCPHKRSKRVRRSKGCDCCCELSKQQDKSLTVLHSSEKVDTKPVKKMHSRMVNSELSNIDTQFDESVVSGPCAVSTPLVATKEPCFFKPSVSELKSDTESEQESTVIPLNEISSETEEVTQIFIKNKIENAQEHLTEPKVADTLVTESLEETKTETTVLEAECVQQICERDDNQEGSAALNDFEQLKKNNVEELKGDTCKALDVELEFVATSEKVDEPAEEAASVEDKVDENMVFKPESSHCSAAVIESDNTSADAEKMKDDDHSSFVGECADPVVTDNTAIEALAERTDTDSPPKLKGLAAIVMANDSPGGGCSSWSPSASPSTSILKKGVKRQQEPDSPSPVNKIRRVSFADPIYQEGLADDIDRRSPVIRGNSSSGSPSSRGLKLLAATQPKLNTTPTKGFLSPGSRILGFKSSKKNLISEMTKESMPSPKESVYPALMNCTTPVDVILPQITSNMWARGLGQLIRAKNIKTIGDLSTLTPTEIKTLPIRSPKVSTVKKALRVYHEQQAKSKGFDEFAVLGEAEKPLNGLDEKPTCTDEEKLYTDLAEPSTSAVDTSSSHDLLTQITALSLQLSTEDLGRYSGSQLFDMQEKLGSMSNCLIRHLQTRWRSPPHESSAYNPS